MKTVTGERAKTSQKCTDLSCQIVLEQLTNLLTCPVLPLEVLSTTFEWGYAKLSGVAAKFVTHVLLEPFKRLEMRSSFFAKHDQLT